MVKCHITIKFRDCPTLGRHQAFKIERDVRIELVLNEWQLW